MMPQVRSVDPIKRHYATNTIKLKMASNAGSLAKKSQEGFKEIPPEISGKQMVLTHEFFGRRKES